SVLIPRSSTASISVVAARLPFGSRPMACANALSPMPWESVVGSLQRQRQALRSLRKRRAKPRQTVRQPTNSIAAKQAHKTTLHPDPVGPEDAGLVGLVGGFKRDGVALAAQALQGRLFIVHESDDDGAILGGIAAADNHRVAVEDSCIDHGIALHHEGVMVA